MRIKGNGNVGIGTSSPSTILHILDTSANNTTLTIGTAGEVPTIKAGGSNTDLQIEAVGGGGFIALVTDSTTRVRINGTGTVFMSSLGSGAVTATSGVLSTTSDMNLKVEDGFIDNALEKVMNLTPRYFLWKEESGLPTDIRQLGFYAQEVNAALGEEAANTPKDENDKWGIYDKAIIAMLTKAIQEQQIQIQNLQEQINILAK